MKIALLVFFFGLILTSVGIVKLPIILGVVVIIYCLLKIIPIRQVYKSVEWPVIVLLASIIPLGAALEYVRLRLCRCARSRGRKPWA